MYSICLPSLFKQHKYLLLGPLAFWRFYPHWKIIGELCVITHTPTHIWHTACQVICGQNITKSINIICKNSENYRSDVIHKITLQHSFNPTPFQSYILLILHSSNPTLFQSYTLQSYTLPILHSPNLTFFQSYTLPTLHSSIPTLFQSYTLPILNSYTLTPFQFYTLWILHF